MKPHRGTTVLVLGILSLTCCGLFTGIPAMIMGKNDLAEMDAGTMDSAGRGTTNGGKICGIIGTILSVIMIIIQLAFVVLAAGASGM